jgi:hypothetical protein
MSADAKYPPSTVDIGGDIVLVVCGNATEYEVEAFASEVERNLDRAPSNVGFTPGDVGPEDDKVVSTRLFSNVGIMTALAPALAETGG